ncbi:aminoacyl-tRNA hydrolase [Brevibacterium sp. 50QC2O2]|uniref:alternative ribosome rescue aminoacyl-tRNA hydrolase ArfB n=1 Tax=Brevibacterium sp. 50QC2O2 TaxID=2968459 RepID=UPI00211CC550|nr:aminoacyl-tRNA hydrolase [Brevibacterium sp. 50QC2O2]
MAEDLRILPGPGAPAGLVVPAAELLERFTHSSGPGGQGVNTADSRVQLSLDLATTSALDDEQRARVMTRLSTRLAGTVLTVEVQDQRAQRQNRTVARARLADLIRQALIPPVVRRATKPTRGSKRRRLAAKKRRSEVKQNRRRPHGD